ncbi:MAG: SBBP repeat-containing protein [Kouleothrix sp.]|nr:SBBP repeat-containing protein [Kouleothrix sp.]
MAKVRPDGGGLVYAGYLGGAGDDDGTSIAVDSTGSAYVAGWTTSTETSFPVLGGRICPTTVAPGTCSWQKFALMAAGWSMPATSAAQVTMIARALLSAATAAPISRAGPPPPRRASPC